MIIKSIRIKNKQLYYKVLGAGQPLVFEHGFAEDMDVWKYQLEDLQKEYRLIIPDLPGSGKSDPIEDMRMEGMAACVKQMIDHELAATPPSVAEKNAGKVILIGHSMGGYIVLAFAEKYPATLRGFGLVHSTAFADTEEKKATRRRGISFMQLQGSASFIKQSTPNLFTEEYRIENSAVIDDMITRYSNFDPKILAEYYEAMIQRPDRTAVLLSFNKPILFIIGKQDKAIPFEDSMKQCHLPQMASIQILEKSAHMGMWQETEKTNQALLSFLQTVQQLNRH